MSCTANDATGTKIYIQRPGRWFKNSSNQRTSSDRTRERKEKEFLKRKKDLINLGATQNYDATLCLENNKIKKFHSYENRQSFLNGYNFCQCLEDQLFEGYVNNIVEISLGKGMPSDDIIWSTMLITQQPAHGGSLPNGIQTFTYEPNEDYFGKDSFNFQVKDKYGCCQKATVTIIIFELLTV